MSIFAAIPKINKVGAFWFAAQFQFARQMFGNTTNLTYHRRSAPLTLEHAICEMYLNSFLSCGEGKRHVSPWIYESPGYRLRSAIHSTVWQPVRAFAGTAGQLLAIAEAEVPPKMH